MRRPAFTLIELIFVIVVMGILAKFGVEFLAQAYNSFIYSKVNNTLQAQSEAAVETVASRLQYRIKDSIIARVDDTNFSALPSANYGSAAPILEWVGSDIDGFRGNTVPHWSGIIDLDDSNATTLKSPGTDTTELNSLINILSHTSGTTINNAAIYFVGSDSDINGYGWSGNGRATGTPLADHNTSVMHRINSTSNVDEFTSAIAANFSGTDIYEYYQLAWTAYAVGISDYNTTTNTGTLRLYYDYQPWEGEIYTNGKSEILMQDVSTFQYKAIGSIVKIQVCVKSRLTNEEHSLCKEKTVY